MQVCVWNNARDTDATNQSYGQRDRMCELGRHCRRRRADVSVNREYGFLEDGLQTEGAAHKRGEEESKAGGQRGWEGSERKREMGTKDS